MRRYPASPFFISYATSGALGANVNLVSDGGTNCCAIRVGQAGDLAVKRARDGATVVIPSVQVGETVEVEATEIVSATTSAQKITVYWPPGA